VPDRAIFRIGELGRRLALAFVAVALLSIATLCLITAATADRDITLLVRHQEELLTKSIAAGAAASYGQAGWPHANLAPVLELARMADASAQVRNMNGAVVDSSPGFGQVGRGTVITEPVYVRGHRVGLITVNFDTHGLGSAVPWFEAKRLRALLMAAAISALLGLLVSVGVARAIAAPLERLLKAVRARGNGAPCFPVEPVRGIGVIRELLESFNETATVLDRQDQLRRKLVADVAHELRTPTAVLQASLEAMVDGMTDPTPENISSLRDEVLRLAMMVDDLQRLAAAESACMQLSLGRHDLAAIAEEAAASMRDCFSAADVTLERRLTDVPVLVDKERMREVILNLLTNALKFTPPGGRALLEVGPGEDGMASVRLSDTGIGIPDEELPHVTERFFRGAHSAEMAAGNGIGMTIVAELVQIHHGRLDIASEVGNGTQVTVILPVAAAESGRRAQLRSPTRSSH
jgi:two-component system, OmpR family, sensor histidine kinase BaeS